MPNVTLCKSCLKDSDLKPKKFRKRLSRELGCEVELSGCLKVCPRKGVAFAVKGIRSFMREPDLESIAAEVTRCLLSGKETSR